MRGTMNFGLPPFRGAVKWLIIVNLGVFLVHSLMLASSPQLFSDLTAWFGLTPALVAKGWLWQLFTYAFLHAGTFHVLFNMLALWMFGSTYESDFGTRPFLEFFFFCVIGAALLTIAVSFGHVLGMTPGTVTVGASGGIFGLLLAFGYLYGDREIFMFPIPFPFKAKVLVAVLMAVAILGALRREGSDAYWAHIGGALFGFIYLKFFPRRGISAGLSESMFGIRNRYYKWKRRQAAKKFEVYMRKHDPKDYFDEHGNYRGPDAKKDNGDAGKPPWVN